MADNNIETIIKKTAKETAKEVRQQFDVVMESIEKDTLGGINDQLDVQARHLERLDGVPAKLDKVDARGGCR